MFACICACVFLCIYLHLSTVEVYGTRALQTINIGLRISNCKWFLVASDTHRGNDQQLCLLFNVRQRLLVRILKIKVSGCMHQSRRLFCLIRQFISLNHTPRIFTPSATHLLFPFSRSPFSPYVPPPPTDPSRPDIKFL